MPPTLYAYCQKGGERDTFNAHFDRHVSNKTRHFFYLALNYRTNIFLVFDSELLTCSFALC